MVRNELAELSAFATVAEERSFTRAAARIGISQSALSQGTLQETERNVR
jgi:DNA-binding transcriptional LysR family regulator